MTYKSYEAPVRCDAARRLFVGLRDEVTFSASSVSALRSEFHHALDDYLDQCALKGTSPAGVRSGRIGVRISPEIHARAARAAMAADKSFAAWFEDTLRHATAEH